MGFRCFSFLQAVQLYIRLDNFSQWHIVSLFWPSWILLTIIFFYLLGISLMILLGIYYKCLGQDDNFHRNQFDVYFNIFIILIVKGLIWTFLCLSCISVGTFLLIRGFIYYYDYKNEGETLKLLKFYIFFS